MILITDTVFNTLEEAYQLARNGQYEEATKALEFTNFPATVHLLSNVTTFEETFWDDPRHVRVLELAVLITQELYNNSIGDLPITDEEFDVLNAVYENVTASVIVGASVGYRGKRKVSAHAYPNLRGTLDKIHFIKNSEKRPGEARRSLEDWLKSIESTFRKLKYNGGTVFDTENETGFIITPKFDGISAVFECNPDGKVYKVLKRGDTERNEAEEMTDLFCPESDFHGASFRLDVNRLGKLNQKFAVKTEIVMLASDFIKFKEKFPEARSPRSAVSSIVNSLDVDKSLLQYLKFIPLRVQLEDGTEIIPYEDFELTFGRFMQGTNIYDSVEMNRLVGALQHYMATALENEYAIDGVVITLVNRAVQEALGRKQNINKFEVALKLPGEETMTTLDRIEFSVGDLGGITPVAVVNPVKLKGNTITNISLGSMPRFESLKLSPGDKVRILYDVIPYLEPEVVSHSNVIEAPTVCPVCGNPLELSPTLRCVFPMCDSRIVGRIVNYVTKMNIKNIDEGTIRYFVHEGILHTIEDLYSIKQHEARIVNLPGFGQKSFDKIVAGIDASRVSPAHTFFGSLGIYSIGRRIWEKVFKQIPVNVVLKMAKDDPDQLKTTLISLPGIQKKTADNIVDGLLLSIDIVDNLYPSVVTLTEPETINEANITHRVVFTKVRDPLFEAYLESQDVLIQSAVNKQTSLVITTDDLPPSSKTKKAEKQGTPVIGITEAYTIFNYQP